MMKIAGDGEQRGMEHPSHHHHLLPACQTEVEFFLTIFTFPTTCQTEVENIQNIFTFLTAAFISRAVDFKFRIGERFDEVTPDKREVRYCSFT